MPNINVPTTMQVAQMPTGPCNSSVPVLIKKTELATTTNTESPKVIKCTFPINNINNDRSYKYTRNNYKIKLAYIHFWLI